MIDGKICVLGVLLLSGCATEVSYEQLNAIVQKCNVETTESDVGRTTGMMIIAYDKSLIRLAEAEKHEGDMDAL